MLDGSMLPPGRLRHAFSPGPNGARMHVVTDHGSDWMTVLRIEDGELRHFNIDNPPRLEALLGREDLTRLDGRPLALVNRGHGLIAIAVGPPTPPETIEFLFVLNIAEMWMPGVPAAKGDPAVQPDWWLLGIDREGRTRSDRTKT